MVSLCALSAFQRPKETRADGLKRINTAQMTKVATKNDYFRLNQATKAGPFKEKKVVLPKGTIISMSIGSGGDNASHSPNEKALSNDYDSNVGLSYALKKRVGVKYPAKGFQIWLSDFTARYPKVRRPAYTLPYGQNVLYSGGVSAFSNLSSGSYHFGHPFNSNALRITSDGYLEFYKYAGTTLAGFDGRWRYTQKPTSYVKISHTVNKGYNKYLYFQYHLKGINDVRLHHKKYQYRLTIKNRHTPFVYINDNAETYASIYSVGGHRYFTMPHAYENFGD